MPNIELYTGPSCGYCTAAKAYLKNKGVQDWTEYSVNEPGRREEMMTRAPGRRTIPQIFINGVHVGGYDDLCALDKAGGLAPLLAA